MRDAVAKARPKDKASFGAKVNAAEPPAKKAKTTGDLQGKGWLMPVPPPSVILPLPSTEATELPAYGSAAFLAMYNK